MVWKLNSWNLENFWKSFLPMSEWDTKFTLIHNLWLGHTVHGKMVSLLCIRRKTHWSWNKIQKFVFLCLAVLVSLHGTLFLFYNCIFNFVRAEFKLVWKTRLPDNQNLVQVSNHKWLSCYLNKHSHRLNMNQNWLVATVKQTSAWN